MTYDREKFEPYDPKQCEDELPLDRQLLDPLLFTEDSPVLTGVKVIERWGYWDGVMSGICEIRGQQFYFHDIVESCWRYYDVQHKKGYEGKKYQHVSRLWRVFAVYDVVLEVLKDQKLPHPRATYDYVNQGSNVIGIFWDYEDSYRKR